MPAKSKAQARAMRSAAAGKSSLGIPRSVGREFSRKTKTTKGLPERVKPRKRKAASTSRKRKAARRKKRR